MQLDPQAYRSTRPHDPSDARPGRIRESERNSTLSQECAVSVAIHGEGPGKAEYVNIGKDGKEEAWRGHNNRGEFGMFVHWNSWRLVLCCGVWLLA